MLGSWPQTQELLLQEDRLVRDWPYLEHSVRFPSFILSSFMIVTPRGEKGGVNGEISLSVQLSHL